MQTADERPRVVAAARQGWVEARSPCLTRRCPSSRRRLSAAPSPHHQARLSFSTRASKTSLSLFLQPPPHGQPWRTNPLRLRPRRPPSPALPHRRAPPRSRRRHPARRRRRARRRRSTRRTTSTRCRPRSARRSSSSPSASSSRSPVSSSGALLLPLVPRGDLHELCAADRGFVPQLDRARTFPLALVHADPPLPPSADGSRASSRASCRTTSTSAASASLMRRRPRVTRFPRPASPSSPRS